MLNNQVYSVQAIKYVWQGRLQSHALLAFLGMCQTLCIRMVKYYKTV